MNKELYNIIIDEITKESDEKKIYINQEFAKRIAMKHINNSTDLNNFLKYYKKWNQIKNIRF